MKKCFVIMLLSCYHLSFGYDNDRDVKLKTFDSARKYPMKVSYIPNIQPHDGKVIKVKSASGLNNRKVKREHVDNVKGELIPQSRKDIHNIKKLSFHGRDRPVTDESNGHNSSSPQAENRPNTFSYQHHHEPAKATQRNDYYTPSSRKHKTQKVYKPEYQSKSSNSVEDIPPYVPDNSPFYPLMKPSPINVMPMNPPSFDTVRNYVHYLKMRQRKFFSDFDNDDEPSPDVKSKQIAASSEGEISYFKEREKELAREEELRNQFSPTNYIKNVQSSDDDVERLFTDESSSNESEITANNRDAANNQRANNDEVVESDEYNESKGNHYIDYADDISREDGEGDESKKTENFVPFKLYAQVRHVEADHHERPTKSNIKEKVSLAKKNIYYKEEGYEDQNYDHGAEKIDYDLKEKKNKKPQRQHNKRRSKRSVDGNVDVSQLPVALAYIKKSEIPQLTGEKLFKHLDELIKNSSIYLPDEDDVERPIRFRPTRASQKYPYYSFPKNVLSEMSAHRYSENIKNYPSHKESLYDYKNSKQCEEIEDEIDPVPSDIEEEGKHTKFNESPKRLNNLGSKIQCFREKYFGKDPFDNPLFKEDDYVEATIPIPINHNISRQSNPLITVYDDVINNIRSGILSEFKRKREAENILKQASEQIAVKAKQVEIPNYSAVAGVSQLSIFDINKFVPKFQGPIHSFSDEDDEISGESDGTAVNELHKINRKQNNFQLEESQLNPPIQSVKNSIVTETPKVKRNNNTKKKKKHSRIVQVPETPPEPISSVIKNVQTPIIVKTNLNTNQKFRRFIPQNAFSYPTKHVPTYYSQQQPQQSGHSNGKTTYRFKLL